VRSATWRNGLAYAIKDKSGENGKGNGNRDGNGNGSLSHTHKKRLFFNLTNT